MSFYSDRCWTFLDFLMFHEGLSNKHLFIFYSFAAWRKDIKISTNKKTQPFWCYSTLKWCNFFFQLKILNITSFRFSQFKKIPMSIKWLIFEHKNIKRKNHHLFVLFYNEFFIFMLYVDFIIVVKKMSLHFPFFISEPFVQFSFLMLFRTHFSLYFLCHCDGFAIYELERSSNEIYGECESKNETDDTSFILS